MRKKGLAKRILSSITWEDGFMPKKKSNGKLVDIDIFIVGPRIRRVYRRLYEVDPLMNGDGKILSKMIPDNGRFIAKRRAIHFMVTRGLIRSIYTNGWFKPNEKTRCGVLYRPYEGD